MKNTEYGAEGRVIAQQSLLNFKDVPEIGGIITVELPQSNVTRGGFFTLRTIL